MSGSLSVIVLSSVHGEHGGEQFPSKISVPSSVRYTRNVALAALGQGGSEGRSLRSEFYCGACPRARGELNQHESFVEMIKNWFVA
jgi:hypothetical protein